jgi:large subunit ribosomal protein L2
MAIIKRKPRSAALRFQSFVSSSDITTTKPYPGLVTGLNRRSGGRNTHGRITVRHRGGGADKKYRIIDFKRAERNVLGKVTTIEYDPNRNVRIMLVSYANGAKHYVLKPEKIALGDTIIASDSADAKVGNSMPLKNVPDGYMVHNVEIRPNSGGTFARSAGASAQIVGKVDGHVTLKMPSGEVRMVLDSCWATIGELGNADYKNISWGKAGRVRHLGFRPSVRGMAMNPVDHPHGGGEGRSKSGSHPRTPWGKGCKGTRTRRVRNRNPLIIKRRKV